MKKIKSTSRKRDKSSKIKDMVNRYGFYQVFAFNSTTGLLYPLVNIFINNLYYQAGISIPKGLSFGGLDLYNYMGRDVAGTWNPQTSTLTVLGFY